MDNVVENFYVTGGTLRHDAPSYVERQADKELLDGLLKGEFCYVLTSRQMGKSSLMVRTACKLREHGINVIALDLTAIGQNLSPEQWYDGLVVRMSGQLRLEDELETFWRDTSRISPLQRFFSAIRDVVLVQRPGPLVIFVDELDVVRSLPFSTDEFFAAIRECYTRRVEDPEFNRLTFCLLGVATPTDLIQDTRITPFNIGKRIELNDFTAEETASLAEGLRDSEAGGQYPEQFLQRIFYWTHGHPYLTQRLCQAIAAIKTSPRFTIGNRQPLDGLCDELFFSNRARERDDNLIFVRERILRSDVDQAALLDLYSKVRSGKRVLDDETNWLVSILRLSGILRVSKGVLQVRNRIYERVFDRGWVEANMPGAELRRQKAAYRRGMVRTASVALVVVSAVLGAGAYYQIYRENQKQTQRLAASYVASGSRSMDEGDLIGSLRWFTDALQLEKRDPIRAELHRVRLAAILRECPKIVQMWFQDGEINDAEFSPDGQRIVTAGVDGGPRVWDVKTGDLIPSRILQSKKLSDASFSRDGHLVVTASEDGNVRVSDVNTDKEFPLLTHPDAVNSAKFNPAGDLVVSACSDGIARVWDVASGLLVRPYTNHTESVRSASFSPDGRRIVTASQDGTAHVWMTATGKRIGHQPFKHKNWVYDASFSPDGRYIVTASFDRTAQIFDTETGHRLLLIHPAAVRSARFSPDGRYVVTACWDYTARVWNAVTGELVKPPLNHSGRVMYASFSPEGRRIVTVTTMGVICLWDLAPRNWLPPGISAYFSSDCNRFATVSNTTVRVWDALASNSVPALFTASNKVTAITLSHDGSRLLTLSGEILLSTSAATTAQLWESSSGKALSQPFSLKTRLTTPSVSQDGQRMITIISNRVQIWDTSSGSRLVQLNHDESVKLASFNPAADRIVTISETNVHIWDVTTGRKIGVLPHANLLAHAEFSPNNRKLVTACSDGSLSEREAQVWDVQTCRKIGSPLQHRDGVRYASFSPDNQRVVTASEDRTAQVWDAATGKRIGPPLRHNDEVLKAVFSQKDGRRIVTVCRDNTARVWDAGTGEPLTPLLKAPSAWLDSLWDARFTGDGQSVVATKGGEARVYSLLPVQRKTEELVLVAQLLSAHQSDQVSGPVPLTRRSVETIWRTLSSGDAKYFSNSSEEIVFWHEREADNSERAEEWFAAKFHVQRLLEAKPHDEALQQRAARIQAMLTRSQDTTFNNDEEHSK